MAGVGDLRTELQKVILILFPTINFLQLLSSRIQQWSFLKEYSWKNYLEVVFKGLDIQLPLHLYPEGPPGSQHCSHRELHVLRLLAPTTGLEVLFHFFIVNSSFVKTLVGCGPPFTDLGPPPLDSLSTCSFLQLCFFTVIILNLLISRPAFSNFKTPQDHLEGQGLL